MTDKLDGLWYCKTSFLLKIAMQALREQSLTGQDDIDIEALLEHVCLEVVSLENELMSVLTDYGGCASHLESLYNIWSELTREELTLQKVYSRRREIMARTTPTLYACWMEDNDGAVTDPATNT